MEDAVFALVGIRGDTLGTVVSIEPFGEQADKCAPPAFKVHVKLIDALYP